MAIADTAPDVIGSVAEAWKVPAELLADPTPACVAAWLIHAPGQSPAWEWYVLSAVHLRGTPGLPPPVLHRPGVTHELVLFALEAEPASLAADTSWRPLHPPNMVEQITAPTDEGVADLAARLATAVTVGDLPAEPPLAGQLEPWRSTVQDSAAHLRGEHDHRHPGPAD